MRITVLTGGTSSERDVALASAVQVIAALRVRGPRGRGGGHRPRLHPRGRREPAALGDRSGTAPPSIDRAATRWSAGCCSPAWAICAVVRDADVLFLALHGGRGEDGTIQTLLEMVGRALHRERPARERHGHGQGRVQAALPAGGRTHRRLGDGPRRPRPGSERELGWPVVVKPSKQGSTVGLTRGEGGPGTTTRRWRWPAGTTTRS